VPVRVAMRLAGRIARRMLVLVVGVMHVPVLMLDRLMQVLVFMRLGQVQIDTDAHEQRRSDEGKVGGSPNSGSARAAPMKGAVEK
jgi:hypothetical protein